MGPVLGAAPIVEEEFAEAGALDSLEKLLGDDLVGVDVMRDGARRLCLYACGTASFVLHTLRRAGRPPDSRGTLALL